MWTELNLGPKTVTFSPLLTNTKLPEREEMQLSIDCMNGWL